MVLQMLMSSLYRASVLDLDYAVSIVQNALNTFEVEGTEFGAHLSCP